MKDTIIGLKRLLSLLKSHRDIYDKILRNHELDDSEEKAFEEQKVEISKLVHVYDGILDKHSRGRFMGLPGSAAWDIYHTAYTGDIPQRKGPSLDAAIDQLPGIIAILESGTAMSQPATYADGFFSSCHHLIREKCEKLFRDKHYAEAIRAAYIEIDDHVKKKVPGLKETGKALMFKVFDVSKPYLSLTPCKDKIEKDEQEGFMHLFAGAMQGIRDPKAHRNISQNDPGRTLEYLALASLLLRRIDEAHKCSPT